MECKIGYNIYNFSHRSVIMKDNITLFDFDRIFNIEKIIMMFYMELPKNFHYDGEQHDFWEMVYVDKGTVQVCRDEEELILKQGEIIFHEPNEFHAIRSLDSAPNFFVICFSCVSPAMAYFRKHSAKLDKELKTFLASIISEAEKTYVIPKNDPDLKELKRKENAPLGGEQLIKTYLEQLLIFLLRAFNNGGGFASFPQKETQTDALVEAIKQYLTQRVEETIRLEDICSEFDYSRSFLNKRFRARMGMSLAAYATQLKVEEAKRLIRETDRNFAQISEQLSFENPQYFSRVFKRCTGMTPTEFRNRAHI